MNQIIIYIIGYVSKKIYLTKGVIQDRGLYGAKCGQKFITNFYHSRNSPLEDFIPTSNNDITTRISGSSFDSRGNLWLADALGSKKLKKLSSTGSWTSYDLSSLQTNKAEETNIVVVDRNNTVWIATRRNGVYAYNENGDRKKALVATPNLGNLPDVNVNQTQENRGKHPAKQLRFLEYTHLNSKY